MTESLNRGELEVVAGPRRILLMVVDQAIIKAVFRDYL
jgi:hypothetical protein